MSLQSATLGRFWLGPQTAKGTAASTYYGFKANLVDVAPSQMTRNIGQLVGGSLLPGGSIKTAAWSGGAMVTPPPLDDYIGWLFYAFAGSVSSVDNGNSTYSHYFPSGADSVAPAKYLTARRMVPATSNMYEQMEDMVPYRLLMGFAPGEFATMRAEMVGRTPTKPDGSGWSYAAKDESSVPIACKGFFELPDDTDLNTITGVTLEMANVVPPLQQVLTLGDYYPYDFPVLSRAITLTFSVLWESSSLYESLYYSGTNWSPTIYSSDVELQVESTGNITGSLPYKLTFYGQAVDWECQPIALAGGNLIAMQMMGTVTAASSGFDWYLKLTNGTANYNWPT
jgi:hypothetical protein